MSDPLCTVVIDGRPVQVSPGMSVAAAMMSTGLRAWRSTRHGQAPRGLFCGIGACFDCLVMLNGEPNVRACLVTVEPGDAITTQGGATND
ncbi:MAG: (2Fe-2S)-binding protein [Candidatus Nanopelagicales bacterium]